MPRVKAEPGDGSEFSKTYTVVRMNATQAKIINAAFALQDSPNQREVEELSAQTGLYAQPAPSGHSLISRRKGPPNGSNRGTIGQGEHRRERRKRWAQVQ
jgi:hypothetical protein